MNINNPVAYIFFDVVALHTKSECNPPVVEEVGKMLFIHLPPVLKSSKETF